jgi:hypothetical protein
MTNEQFSQARALYEEEGLSFADIGATIGFSRQAIYNRFQKEGVPIRDKKASARLRTQQYETSAEENRDIIVMALEAGKSAREIAEDLELPIQTIKGIFATLPELTRRKLSYKGSDAVYSDDDLVACLKYVAGKLGRVPGVTAYGKFRKDNLTEVVVNQQPLPHAMTLVKRFDTWSAACKKAGFIATAQPNGLGAQTFDEADVASAIRRVTDKLGHAPSIGEYQENCAVSEPSANTIIKRFGGWILALDAILCLEVPDGAGG